MINMFEVNETNKMIEQENLDVRTITLGISLLDCIDSDLDKLNEKIYNKITTYAHNIINHDIHTNYVHKPNKSAVIHQVIHIIHIFVNNKSGLHRFFSERMFWMCFTKNAFFRQRKIRSCIQNRLVDSLDGTRTKLLDFLQVLGYHEP